MPPPSPVGPRGSAAAAAASAAGGAGAPAAGGGVIPGPGTSGGVPPSPLGGPTPPPPTQNRKVLLIIDPATGKPIELPDAGSSGSGVGSISGVGRMGGPPPGRSPRTTSGAASDVAKEMREKAQAALKSDTPLSAMAAAAAAGAAVQAAAKKPSMAANTGVAKPSPSAPIPARAQPAFKGVAAASAPIPAVVPAAASEAPWTMASSTGRSGPAKVDGDAPTVEVSFGSYGNIAIAATSSRAEAKEPREEAAAAAAQVKADAVAAAAEKEKAEALKRAEEARKAAEEEKEVCDFEFLTPKLPPPLPRKNINKSLQDSRKAFSDPFGLVSLARQKKCRRNSTLIG